MSMNDAQNEKAEKEEQELKASLEDINRIVLVLSGKGGVGKSTVAVNIAVGLAAEGLRVGLLDIDFHGPSVPAMLGLENEKLLAVENKMVPVQFTPNLQVMSIGFMLQERDDAVIWRGPMKYGVIRQFLANVEWGGLDYLVVDAPPGTGDEPLTIAQMTSGKASAVVVTTPQRVSVDDVRKCVTFCRRLELPVLGVVENMSGFVCPHCGETVNIFDTGGGEKLAFEMEVPFLGRIPIDTGVVGACDSGNPYIIHGEGSAAASGFRAVLDKIINGDPKDS